MSDLVFAFIDAPGPGEGGLSRDRARELSLGFTRFKFSQPIIEGPDAAELLERAVEMGGKRCVLMPYGCLLQETWTPGDSEHLGLLETLRSLPANGRLAAGSESGLSSLLVVDLEHFRKKDRLSLDALREQAAGQPLPEIIHRNLVNLHSEAGEQWLADTQVLSDNLRKAVFVWNIEAYDDVEQPASTFEQPMRALYTVAAGFKSNRILHSHGANPDTRMVVFDYSAKGLQFRRLLHEDWDGRDYPGFLVRLLQKLPATQAHYLLWHGADPDNPDLELMQQRWQQELERWGGAEAFLEHWRMFRRMKPEYVLCDLLSDNRALLESITDEPGSLIWWSNAFLTINSIWHYEAARRQALFRDWVQRLAARAPRLQIVGADCNNLAISGTTAGEYETWLEAAPTDPLDLFNPRAPGSSRLRF